MDILGGNHQTKLNLGVISMCFMVFFKVNVKNGENLGCKHFKYFWGMLDFSDIFGG